MKRILIVTAIVLTMAVALTASACGPDKPAKSLRDFLVQPPNSAWQTYGYSEDTFRLYNFVVIMQIAQRNKIEIEKLKQTVKILKALIEANSKKVDDIKKGLAQNNELQQTLKNFDELIDKHALKTAMIIGDSDIVDSIKVFHDPNDLRDAEKIMK